MRRTIFLAVSLLLATSVFAGTGKVIIVNSDPPGVGFNDLTPVAPIGGNPGTTLGAQRLNVYLRAAAQWTQALDTNVDIRVRAGFIALECSENSGVLGQTSVPSWSANFAGAPRSETWYPAALANKFAGLDLTPTQDDMIVQFNVNLGKPNCFANRGWYYGFDGNEGIDESFVHVVLHEIGHGLGISSRSMTDFVLNRPSVFDLHTFDTTIGLRWDQMTQQQRDVSLTNTGNLVWDGPIVKSKAPSYLEAATVLTVTQPSPVARDYVFGTASFGPSVREAPMAGRVVAAADEGNESGPLPTDGCTTFTNAAAINGNIALIDRGACPFVQKALNAQAAGAVGVMIANNVSACAPLGLGGTNPDVRIAVISITQSDGNSLRAQLAQNEDVRAMAHLDPTRLAGTSEEGYVRLYAPCAVEGGSSKHHWSTEASPNLLMEPFINADLPDSLDLSIYQLMDMGWTQPPRTGRRFLKR